jgi:SAM-dependent methyltransferase
MFVDGARPLSSRRLTACDEYLIGAATELLDHDDRLRGITVDVRFDRGVAHLTGAVAGPGQLRLARELIGRLGGVLAVWSRVHVAGREPVIVDLGCGQTKQYPGSIGVDRQAGSTVDVLADLARGLPFADRCVDVVFAVHVLEHLVDFLPLVDECHRVLRPDGMLHVLSPWWRFANAVADPAHVRLLDIQTVKGICDRRDGTPRWYPVHAGCDGASVFADLAPLADGAPGPPPGHLARFFD